MLRQVRAVAAARSVLPRRHRETRLAKGKMPMIDEPVHRACGG
jgi:hypothetical protein